LRRNYLEQIMVIFIRRDQNRTKRLDRPGAKPKLVKALFIQADFDLSIDEEMISRALVSEQDIKEGRIYTIEEAEVRLNKRFVV